MTGPVDDYLLLTDPEWADHDGDVPFEAVIGMWPVGTDGVAGPFRSNPQYRPRFENSPSDPLDALIRLAAGGDAELEQLQAVLRDSTIDLALNGDGRPLVTRSDDGVPCVLVATSAPHQERMFAPDWRRIDLAGLTELLTDDLGVLINPGSPTWTRLTGDFVRAAVR